MSMVASIFSLSLVGTGAVVGGVASVAGVGRSAADIMVCLQSGRSGCSNGALARTQWEFGDSDRRKPCLSTEGGIIVASVKGMSDGGEAC